MKNSFTGLVILFLLLVCSGSSKANDTSIGNEVVPGIPVKNTVTLVDLGATTCIPCKMMAPILEELKQEYKGRVEVFFIDVYDKSNAGKSKAFNIFVIPSQIFYDKQGREVFRHTGFLDKKSIVVKLEELLKK
jgi:thioredoxin 1